MAESKRQAHPDDERTPEQWAQFRQAEAKNQEDQTRRLDRERGGKPVELEVQNSTHKNQATIEGEPKNG